MTNNKKYVIIIFRTYEKLKGVSMKVVFACSFGSGRANFRLAEAAERIVTKEETKCVIIAQWEVARELEKQNIPILHVVEPNTSGAYLDTIDVWNEAKICLALYDAVEIIIVAQPFIHGIYIERMIEKDGYQVCHKYDREIGRIGFDSESQQWWTRGPLRMILYVLLSVCGLEKYFR
ncbi:MAG: hypothetical protein WCJ74_03290 [bacterium]